MLKHANVFNAGYLYVYVYAHYNLYCKYLNSNYI